MRNYCLHCGSELKNQVIEGRLRARCEKCGWVNYEQRKVSAGVRVEKDGKLLLVQRGIDPWQGCWHMPAGYLEVDEEPVDAATREAFEETGLHVNIKDVLKIYTYSDDPRGNGIVLIYDAVVLDGNLSSSFETIKAEFFLPEEIKTLPLAGGGAKSQVNDWLTGKGYFLGYRK
jgi:8-oxo-dGTP diphosphatase